jgi:hypothetical protein
MNMKKNKTHFALIIFIVLAMPGLGFAQDEGGESGGDGSFDDLLNADEAEDTANPDAEAPPEAPMETEPEVATEPEPKVESEAEPEAAKVEKPEAGVKKRKKPGAWEETLHQKGGAFGLGLVIAPKLAAGINQVSGNGLGAGAVFELELGYMPPLFSPIGRDIQIFLVGQYTAPTATQSLSGDGRLPGNGDWQYELTLHQWVGTFGLLYRIPVPPAWMRPYVAAGMRGYWTTTVADGSAGENEFGTYEESAFDLGGYGAAGVDFFLGPGALLLELQFGMSALDSYILRETSTAALNIGLGYRFML